MFEFLIVLTASLVSGDNQDNLLFRLKSCNYDGFDDDDDNARRCEDMTSPRQIQFNSMEWNGIDQWVLVKM